jgi:hypothetical protein
VHGIGTVSASDQRAGQCLRYYKFCALVSELLAQVEVERRVLRLAGQTWRTLSNVRFGSLADVSRATRNVA